MFFIGSTAAAGVLWNVLPTDTWVAGQGDRITRPTVVAAAPAGDVRQATPPVAEIPVFGDADPAVAHRAVAFAGAEAVIAPLDADPLDEMALQPLEGSFTGSPSGAGQTPSATAGGGSPHGALGSGRNPGRTPGAGAPGLGDPAGNPGEAPGPLPPSIADQTPAGQAPAGPPAIASDEPLADAPTSVPTTPNPTPVDVPLAGLPPADPPPVDAPGAGPVAPNHVPFDEPLAALPPTGQPPVDGPPAALPERGLPPVIGDRPASPVPPMTTAEAPGTGPASQPIPPSQSPPVGPVSALPDIGAPPPLDAGPASSPLAPVVPSEPLVVDPPVLTDPLAMLPEEPGDDWLSPGNSPGTLTLDSDFGLNGGTLLFEILGTRPGDDYDQLIVNGKVDLDDGIIVFAFINGFVPEFDEFFDVILADQISLVEQNVDFYYGFFDTPWNIHAPQDLSMYTRWDGSVLPFDVGVEGTDPEQRLTARYDDRTTQAPAPDGPDQAFTPSLTIPVAGPLVLFLAGLPVLGALAGRRRR